MPRIKIQLPEQFPFTTVIPVRITDLNYGGHVGNDTILSLIHEARIQFLDSLNASELDFFGSSLIMSDAGIEFKNELFYKDAVRASVASADLTRVSFDLYYLLEKQNGESWAVVAVAKTGMVCFNYKTRRPEAIPDQARAALTSYPARSSSSPQPG